MKRSDATASFKTLKRELREKKLYQVYLIYGEERYLKLRYFNNVRDALGGKIGDMNTNVYEGKGVNIGAVIDQAETLPFFAERRVILMKDTGLCKSGGDELAQYLEDCCETTAFVLCESEVDERTKLYKTIRQKGYVAEINAVSPEELIPYVSGYLEHEGKRISKPVAVRFIEKSGTDMTKLFCELDKMVCYCMDKEEITLEDVEMIVSDSVEDQVFDMINALCKHDAKTTMDKYSDLLALKEPPIKILVLMERHFNTLLQIKDLRTSGQTGEMIMTKLKINRYFFDGYLTQAGRFSLSELEDMIGECVRTETDIKTGRIKDTLGVETLLLWML